jgi:4-hydroxybenzoate polyprenyltransferase
MIFFPPFLSGHIVLLELGRGIPLLCAFCIVSSAGYIFNDLLDCERDVHHPQKSLRALPSGVISVRRASIYAVLLLISGLMLAGFFSSGILLLIGYAVISFVYSLWLKNIPVIDIFSISAGFLIRLQAGGEQFHIPISNWLFITVFLLAIFLSTGKRLSESRYLGARAGDHRVSLNRYPSGFLAGTLYMTGSAVLVTYSMYALQNHRLLLTVPLCLFGLLRYILRVSSGKSGDPTESLLKDWLLLVVSVLWLLMVVWGIYR